MAGEQAAWYDAWGQLKQTAQRLDEAVAVLRQNESFALSRPNLADDYRTKMAEVETMRARASWLRDTIRQALGALGVQLDGLGLVPALVWPVVAGTVAWLGSKALDLWKFAQQVDEQRRLEERGMAPARAASIVQQKAESGTLGAAVKSLAPVLVIVGLGLGAWWYFNRPRTR